VRVEQPEIRPTIRVIPGGPLLVSGGVPLHRLKKGPDGWALGSDLAMGASYALCRCGASSKLPVCDREPPYGCFEEAPPTGLVVKPFRWDLPDGSTPAMALKPDGPLRVGGGVAIRTPEGAPIDPGVRVSLCRCGNSGAQPLCDGSHKVVGFHDPEPPDD
jgi:CDGSH-type Zn-finger protein